MMRKGRRDLSEHARFLGDVIKALKQIDPNFAVCTEGPWYSKRHRHHLRFLDGETRALPRGVRIKDEEIYILTQPVVIESVVIDESLDNSASQKLIRHKKNKFDETPALMLHQVHQAGRGKAWQQAWEQTEATWRRYGWKVPDFKEFLEPP